MAGRCTSNRSSNFNSSPDWLRVVPSQLLPRPTRFLASALCLLAFHGTARLAGAEALQDAHTAFDKQRYDQALQLLDGLQKHGKDAPAVRRLKVRTLAKAGKPLEAVAEYEALVPPGQPDDTPLLREVAFGVITPLLKDMRDQMRGAGYTALREIESDEAVPYFEDGLSDGSGVVRALVSEGLARLKTGQKSERFRKAVTDQAAFVRANVLKGLGRSGDRSAIAVVETALKDDQAMVRAVAAGALVMLGRQEAFSEVRKAAQEGIPEGRSAAVRMMGELQDRRALPVLQAALKDRQPSIRGAAAASLGELRMPESAVALTPLLADPVPAVRSSAALALSALGARDRAPDIKKLFDDHNHAVRAAAAAALLGMGRPFAEVATVIRQLSQEGDPGLRASAGRALGRSGEKDADEAVAALRVLLSDALPRPRIAAARSLGHVGGPRQAQEIIGVLKQALRDQDEAVRATVAGALIRWLDGKAGGGKGEPLEG